MGIQRRRRGWFQLAGFKFVVLKADGSWREGAQGLVVAASMLAIGVLTALALGD